MFFGKMIISPIHLLTIPTQTTHTNFSYFLSKICGELIKLKKILRNMVVNKWTSLGN